MLRDLTNQKKVDKQAAIAAIAALQTKSWDVNPYTVADELKISAAGIYRSTEIMDLINESRPPGAAPEAASPEANQLIIELSNLQLQVQALEQRVGVLESENEQLKEGTKDAWQKGYKSGWEEASQYLAIESPDDDPGFTKLVVTEDAPADNSFSPTAFSQAQEIDRYDFESTANFATDSHISPNPYTETDLESLEPADSNWAEVDSTNADNYLEETQESEEEHISPEDLQNILKQHREKSEIDSGQGIKGKGLAASKFAKGPAEPHRGFVIRSVPPDIRKACMVLGLRPEEINRQTIFEAWKREITRPGTHPDQGGDTEMAVYLNTAKDELLTWWSTQEPKLAKKFANQLRNASQAAESETADETVTEADHESDSSETEPGM